MFYRVVMQGRTVGGADLATVKREFVRVTGLPVSVADDMFGGMPKVIKRKAEQADAERIAATLRAIGAAATVERANAADADDGEDEGIEIIAAPLGNGPPTVVPGMAPPEAPPPPKQKAWVRGLRQKWPVLVGTLGLVGAVAYFADEVSGWASSFRPAPATATAPKPAKAPSESAEAAAANVTFNAGLLHGPWRCVDQRTGLGVYWSYGPDGALVFHGEVLSDRPAASSDAATGWKLEGAKLLHRHTQGQVDAFNVANLTLSRLRYLGDRGLEIECRRP